MKPLLIIPMTGISSRFTAAGYDRPKFMLEVDGQFVIDHVIDMFPGWDDVIFICNPIHLDDASLGLERHLLTRRPQATIVRAEGKQAGPGGAVLFARTHIDLDRPVVVNYCDFTAYWDSEVLSDRLFSGEVEGVIPCYTGDHPHMEHSTSYAYVKVDKSGDVAAIQEKMPWTDDPHSEFASSGTYGFSSGSILLEGLDKQVEKEYLLNGEYYLSLTYTPLLERGARIEVQEIQHFMQWGTPQDFEEYRAHSRAIAAWTGNRIAEYSDFDAPAARVILASGAGQRFVSAGYSVAKPLLPLSGVTVIEHVLATIPGSETVVVSRADLSGHQRIEAIASEGGLQIALLPGLSQGQAESALTGLRQIRGQGPVTVGACDALSTISRRDFEAAVNAAGPDGIVPWVAWDHHHARRNPSSYGWVAGRHMVNGVWIKEAPATIDAGVLIGTFTFASAESAIAQIEELIADDERVNDEFYLDSLIGRALRGDRLVVPLSTATFTSVGTPSEYEAARYWQSCFQKWVHHPYALAADPLVPANRRADLDAEFRRWPRYERL